MITKYTKETVKEIRKEDNYYSEFYYINSLVADKLRVLYGILGWSHMMKDFGSADDVVESMFSKCLTYMEDGSSDASCSTAGLTIRMGYEEEYFVVDYTFNLI